MNFPIKSTQGCGLPQRAPYIPIVLDNVFVSQILLNFKTAKHFWSFLEFPKNAAGNMVLIFFRDD